MPDTGCPHPESDRVAIEAGQTFVQWCTVCGSIYDNNGDHGAEAGTWRSPSSIVLPGWACSGCQTFCGAGKELMDECRHCGAPRSRA